MVMAEAMGITVQALSSWVRRHESGQESSRSGRPEAIPAAARWKLRSCYLTHYKQWGPQVLRPWAQRQGLGTWSATTIARVIADLRDEPEPKTPPTRYEIVGSNGMWSEDGTGFRQRGRKRELVVAQDEHARFKVGYELVDGPASEEAVCRNLEAAFKRYGAPLVLKHDGGSIFHGERVQELLRKHEVTELTGPRHYPQYNGKKERSMRDIKSFERAMRRHRRRSTLGQRIGVAVHDLNEERPRPVLGGQTAREVFERDRIRCPDRRAFRKEVDRTERKLRVEATTRADRDSARRRAVEQVLLAYGLMTETGDVSHNFEAAGATE
ncbi:MAG: DDE-type integrase/transposase/recombinase [Gemmatimonadetes bacterium]|nr:DDE-type integrase/transposase/recombinase [Gemmatimonadota bacterium]